MKKKIIIESDSKYCVQYLTNNIFILLLQKKIRFVTAYTVQNMEYNTRVKCNIYM